MPVQTNFVSPGFIPFSTYIMFKMRKTRALINFQNKAEKMQLPAQLIINNKQSELNPLNIKLFFTTAADEGCCFFWDEKLNYSLLKLARSPHY